MTRRYAAPSARKAASASCRAVGDGDAVAVPSENAAQNAGHNGFVVHNEDRCAGRDALAQRGRGGQGSFGAFRKGQRQADKEARACAGFAFDRDGSAVPLDDAPGHGQAQPRAFKPGGEEWIKNAADDFGGHARARVGDFDFNFIFAARSGGERKISSVRHGIDGVVDHVDQHFAQAAGFA